ncbi:BadF/BadG/BcrA/BcrD ATPase family protein [Sneathiella chinensis]|nr:BadF/BadG/BcrA/BcrD ATPase family protein [Sneathiella chinensis]
MTDTGTQAPALLAADCGGTTCRVALFDAGGALLGTGISGPANITLGGPALMQSLMSATGTALKQAGIKDYPLENLALSAGIAGLVTDAARTTLRDLSHPFRHLVAHTDAATALLGAHDGGDGAILITGTGSCGFGLQEGAFFSIGGWGPKISDQGSGARLGMSAARRALKGAEDIMPATPYTRAVMAELGGSAEAAYLWAETATPADFAALAPLTFDFARRRDVVALTLLGQIADDIEQMIEALKSRSCQRISHLGGLAAPIAPFLSAEVRALLSPPMGDALQGAKRMYENRLWDVENIRNAP